MIRWLLAMHPRAWRTRYGAELRDLLEASPLTVAVVFDVLRNALVQHARAHARLLRIAAALMVSGLVEVLAVRAGLTDNVLWLPSSDVHAAALAALLAPWFVVAQDVRSAVGRRRRLAGRS